MTNEITKTNEQFTLQAYSNNLKSSIEFAKTLLQTQMVPSHFKNPESVVTAILYGQELGFSPMQALQSVVVIQGKPTLDTNSLKALIIQAGGRIETVVWDDKICTLRFVRGEWKEEYSFNMGDANQMGLSGKDNWKKMPKAMLYARCVSIGARNMFADATKGFYSTDEMKDSVQTTDTGKVIQYRNQLKKEVKEEPIDVTPKAIPAFEGDPWEHVLDTPDSKYMGQMLCELDPTWITKVAEDEKFFSMLLPSDQSAVKAAYNDLIK